MKNTIYVLDLDNYYSRKFQIEYNSPGINAVNLYLEHMAYSEVSINFNPNDGISTTIVLNCKEWQVGNYAIVVDENNNLVSRWFIMEAVRIREGQYRINLRRDVVMDYWDIIQRTPALIEKADLSYDDPLIFNNENFIVNQIKTSETLLKDHSGCPWLVAYIAKDTPAEKLSGTAKVGANRDSEAIPINQTIEVWEADHKNFVGDYKRLDYQIYTTNFDKRNHFLLNADSAEGSVEGKYGYQTNSDKTSLTATSSGVGWDSVYKGLKNGLKAVGIETVKNAVPAYTPDRHTAFEIEEYLALDGKTIYDTNGKYFYVEIKEVSNKIETYEVAAGALYNLLSEVINNSYYTQWGIKKFPWKGKPNNYTFRVKATYNAYETKLTPMLDLQTSFNISFSRPTTEDAAYDILAIPYGQITAIVEPGVSIQTNAEIGLAIIQAMAAKMSESCYDIQLVPYCPLQAYLVDNQIIDTSSGANLTSYITTGEDDNKVGVIYHVPSANFTFNIFESITAATSNIQRKINNDCDKWRLSSPNFANYFDFSVEKNNGVQHFNVDCCYKPYNPYIHINPNFNGLYGQDFNDPRGLVCGGDFSLTQVKSAWEAYELQNKNYQQTFDRQIQNMEFNNKYQSIQDTVQAFTGAVSGTVSGAATGLMVGGPYGAIAGGAVGGISSTAGGIADVLINQKLRNEAIDYTIDQFGYSLGNIKAIPLTLSKISAFNANNKVFPVLEYYTCTDREKEAYANKIAYNGMTVMAIGKIEDYITATWEYTINESVIKSKMYIKAKLIHLDMFEDYHIASEIASEINKGIFIEVIE